MKIIKGISHIAMHTSDMEKTLNFYCDILGFKLAFRLPKPDGTPGITYIQVAKDQFLEFFNARSEKEENSVPARPGYHHLCLEVTDINAIADRIRSSGLTLTTEPKMGGDGNYQCWVEDHDGNKIEFMQISEQSPQFVAIQEF